MFHSRLIFSVVLFVLFTACATNTATPATTASPTRVVEIRVLPKNVRFGTRAMMVGSGFERDEPVAFYLIRPDGSKTSEGDLNANKTGGAAYEIDVTEDWPPGQYIAHVRSRKNPSRAAE